MRSVPLLASLLALLPSLLAAQVDPAQAPLQAGQRALEEGRLEAARTHFLHALEVRPDDPRLLECLLAVTADDLDERLLWAHHWAGAAADARGKLKVPREVRSLLPKDDPHPVKLAGLRAAAVADLAALAEKRAAKAERAPEDLLIAYWARRAARRLASGSPALREAYTDALPVGFEVSERFHEPVVKALHRAMRTAASGGERELAFELARSLHALGVQAAFDDLQGPRPAGMERYRSDAGELLASLRESLRRSEEEPWTVEQLEWLVREEGEAFTRAHGTFARPGVALSPGGRYRIETDCGHETLLGVAASVELHHARLVDWYGEDPFLERQGLVRIVPQAGGLEAEGTPFWWAGGFQSGDRTVLRFSHGSIEALGHGLTHELTHRFDGALFPGIPAWLAEGRAVWTGAAYAQAEDESFVANHASFGTIENAFVKGYGGEAKLRELVDGTLEDYRDNYVAGYALFVYLNTWEVDGRPLFAEALGDYMSSASRDEDDPVERFERHFADGKAGRPLGFLAFAEGFGTFVRGFYWKEPAPFADRYERKLDGGGRREYVYDEPTWTWTRERAEPVFGQGQARRAGDLLLAVGDTVHAQRAWLWTWAADGPDPALLADLEVLLRDEGHDEAAWVVRDERLGDSPGTRGEPPTWLARGPFEKLLAGLEEAQAAYLDAGRPLAALGMRAELWRAWHAGPEGEAGEPVVVTPRSDSAPVDPPLGRVGRAGWVEDGLTRYEEKRVADLWYVDDDGDLHVGREAPRTGTGRLDQRAHQRHAFVRSEDWIEPGRYRLRARVRFTTSFAAGAVVLGYTRRDRNLRFQFNAGDFMYSIGESDKEPTFEAMGWGLSGTFEREGHLRGSAPGGQFTFARPAPAFLLELLIDGPTVLAYLDGRYVGTYSDPLGVPIEGHLGFATGMGAIRVESPTLERLDGVSRFGAHPVLPLGVDLASATWPPFDDLENRRLHGLPERPNGTLLVWVPAYAEDEPGSLDVDRIERKLWESQRDLARILEVDASPQTGVLLCPEAVGPEFLAKIRAELAELDGAPFELATHRVRAETADEGKRWLWFVDSSGLIRHASSRLRADQTGVDSPIAHWLAVFRDHGEPARELPAVQRGPAADDDEGDGSD